MQRRSGSRGVVGVVPLDEHRSFFLRLAEQFQLRDGCLRRLHGRREKRAPVAEQPAHRFALEDICVEDGPAGHRAGYPMLELYLEFRGCSADRVAEASSSQLESPTRWQL